MTDKQAKAIDAMTERGYSADFIARAAQVIKDICIKNAKEDQTCKKDA